MVNQVVPHASVTPQASPVDRFVMPAKPQAPSTSPLLELAKGLQAINPALHRFIETEAKRKAVEEEASGIAAEMQLDPNSALAANRDAWNELIKQQRKFDKENGTNLADKLAAASPHFVRGLYKARAQRLGVALRDKLIQAYDTNPIVNVDGTQAHLQDVDDPSVVQEWVQMQTAEFVSQYGLNALDPVIVAQVFAPLVVKAQTELLGRHTDLRLERRNSEYLDEVSASTGIALTKGGDVEGSDIDAFIRRLAGVESSGDYNRVNDYGYTGLLQFGQARLDDYNKAHGTNYKLKDLIGNKALQDELNRWHIADIDRVIDENGFLDKGWSRDGLRAVAHLGGIGGMIKFVRSGGKYNPKDGYGTSLMDYYKRFSTPAGEVQKIMDEAVQNGVDPQKVNHVVVNSVIARAIEERDPSLLAVLDEITTGSGPLGRIAWVKQARQQAELQIENLEMRDEDRAAKIEERQRTEAKRAIISEAFSLIEKDPGADLTPLVDAALKAGLYEVAKEIKTFQERAIEAAYDVKTLPEDYADLRYRIFQATDDASLSELAAEITAKTGVTLTTSDASSLIGLIERKSGDSIYKEVRVKKAFSLLEKALRERFGKDTLFGPMGGEEIVFQGLDEAYVRFETWLREHPNASKDEASLAARDIVRDILNSKEYMNSGPKPIALRRDDVEGGAGNTRSDGSNKYAALLDLLRSKEGYPMLERLAEMEGLPVDEFAKKYGILE